MKAAVLGAVGLLIAACGGTSAPAPRMQPQPLDSFLLSALRAADMTRAGVVAAFGQPDSVRSLPTANRHDPAVTDSLVTIFYGDARYDFYIVSQGPAELLDHAIVTGNRHLRYDAPRVGTPADSLRAWWGEPVSASSSALEYDCSACEVPHPARFVIAQGMVREIHFDLYVD